MTDTSAPAGVVQKWPTDDDPVRDLAVKLAARANHREEEDGEWTWHDIAECAMQALNTRPVTSTLDPETVEACAKVADRWQNVASQPMRQVAIDIGNNIRALGQEGV